MLKELEKIIDECDASNGDGEKLEIELRQAALQLWRSQFLYQSDYGSKGHYDLIQQYRGYFENLFDALGYRIVGGRPNDQYLGLLANFLPPRQSMRLDESLMLLVLALHYKEAFSRYEINELGEIEVDGETILQLYEERARRTRPLVTRVHEILTTFRQRGLIRLIDQGGSKKFSLFLRPAIPIVVSDDALSSLDEFLSKSKPAEIAEPESVEQEAAEHD